jgi:hypothetical protein
VSPRRTSRSTWLLGTFAGGALRVRPQPFPRGARVAFPLAGLLVAGLIRLRPRYVPADGRQRARAAPGRPGGGPRAVTATVAVDPPSAAADAKWLTMTAWQGGGLVGDRLGRVREGVYRTSEPIPVRPFVRDKDLLQREAKDGAAGLTLLGYGIVLAITLSIIALNAWALVRLATDIEDADAPAADRFRRAPAAQEPVPAT